MPMLKHESYRSLSWVKNFVNAINSISLAAKVIPNIQNIPDRAECNKQRIIRKKKKEKKKEGTFLLSLGGLCHY